MSRCCRGSRRRWSPPSRARPARTGSSRPHSMMKLWDRAEQTLAGALGVIALLLALWQVASRYLFPQHSISCAEEVIVYLMIWAIMIVSSGLVRADGHVRPDLVLAVVPDRVKRWMEVFNSLA